MPTIRPLPVLQPEQLRHPPSSFAWIDHRLRRDGWLNQLPPKVLAFYVFLVFAADERGLSCWRLDRIQREMPDLTFSDLHQARDQLTELGLVAYRPWSQHSPDGSYQVLRVPARE